MRPIESLCTLALALQLAACNTAPSSAGMASRPAFDATAAVAAIRATGGVAATELEVQPLRDPRVEDLRQQASLLESRRMYRAAADALDHALTINPDDPALLQERAETALLQQQLPDAEGYAQRAFATGSKIGPLCRRHWETIAQVRSGLAAAHAPVDAAASQSTAADARRQRDACTVAAPNRY